MSVPAELYLRLLLRRAPGVVWATDAALRVTHIESRIPNLSGIDAGLAMGKTVQEFLAITDPTDPAVAHHLEAVAGQSRSFTYWFHGRCFDVLIDPLRDRDRRVVGCVGVALDVTESMLARRRFEESQEVAHVGSFEWDMTANRVSWSDELHRIYGVDKHDFDGTYEAFIGRVFAEDRQMTEDVVSTALREAKPFKYDHRVVRPDGGVRFLHTRGDVIVDQRSKPARIVGSCWDATELMETTRSLARSVSLMEATINATADGILVVDLAGKISTFNRSFTKLWRIPPELAKHCEDESLIAFVLDQLEDPDGFNRRVHELYGQPERKSFDVLSFKDGRVFERYSAPQWLGPQIIGRVWSFRDVTTRARAERQAKEAVGMLAIAAHDVRNPLGALELQLDVVQQTLDKGQLSRDVLGAQITSCHRFVARASSLLSSLLEVTRIGAGKLILERKEVDLARLVRGTVERSRIEIEAAHCEVVLDARVPVVGRWDAQRLDQIVTNLLSNALKYGRGKPIEIAVKLVGRAAVLTVRDHGIGIPVQDQKRIFEQFERAVAEGRGAGLGLWIVDRLVEALHGYVRVDSRVGQGSTFTVELPLDVAGEARDGEVKHGGDPHRR